MESTNGMFYISNKFEDAVLMGDFNFGDGSEQDEIPEEYVDW